MVTHSPLFVSCSVMFSASTALKGSAHVSSGSAHACAGWVSTCCPDDPARAVHMLCICLWTALSGTARAQRLRGPPHVSPASAHACAGWVFILALMTLHNTCRVVRSACAGACIWHCCACTCRHPCVWGLCCDSCWCVLDGWTCTTCACMQNVVMTSVCSIHGACADCTCMNVVMT